MLAGDCCSWTVEENASELLKRKLSRVYQMLEACLPGY